MPDIEIELPDGEVVLFPDGTTDAAIEAALSTDRKATDGNLFSGGFGGRRPIFAPRSGDILTGAERGRGTLPELGTLTDFVPGGFLDEAGAVIGIAAGFFTTPDEAARADILRKNIPGVDFENDEFDNIVVLLPDGRKAFLNAPGLSVQDFADLGAGIVKFLPAAKFAKVGLSLLTRIIRGGLAAVATSVAEDVAAIPQGSQQGIDITKAGITGVIGGAAEFVAPVLAPARSAASRAAKPGRLDLTRGEASGDTTLLSREAQIRGEAGTGGDILRAQRAEQTKQARSIIDEIQDDIAAAGGRPPIPVAKVGTEEIVEEVTGQAGVLLNSIDDAFDVARGANASLTREGVDALGGIRKTLLERGIEPDPVLFPATMKALERIEGLVGKEQTLTGLDQARRVVNTLQGTAKTPSDRLGVGLVKKRFDQFLDDAFDNALFTGDEAALELIKKARGLRTEFGRRFQENTRRTRSGKIVPDPGGKAVESILQRSPTDEAVSNMIFGRGRVFNDNNAVQVVKAIRRATGDSPAVDAALQQMALRRIAQKAVRNDGFDPKAFVTSFDDAMKQSPTLMKELFQFAPNNILNRLRLLRNDAQKLILPKGAGPARVSATRKQLGDAWVSLMGALGLGGQLPGIPSGLRGGAIGRQLAGSGRRGVGAARSTQEALESVGGEALLPGRPDDFVISSIIAATRQGIEE